MLMSSSGNVLPVISDFCYVTDMPRRRRSDNITFDLLWQVLHIVNNVVETADFKLKRLINPPRLDMRLVGWHHRLDRGRYTHNFTWQPSLRLLYQHPQRVGMKHILY